MQAIDQPPSGYSFCPSSRNSPLVILTSTIQTLNDTRALTQLYQSYLNQLNLGDSSDLESGVSITNIMRECCLKTITLNGVPKSINSLAAIRGAIPPSIAEKLAGETPQRQLTVGNLNDFKSRGQELWTSIYHPFHDKLRDILNQNHPDMGSYIIDSHYGALLAPPTAGSAVGRVETSIIAIACLRTQSGVNPQLLSHAFGLEKAGEGEYGWIASDVGVRWVLESTDKIIESFRK